MDKLIAELHDKILLLNKKTGESFNLSNSYWEQLYSAYPFNAFEYAISHLIGHGVISLEQYIEIRNAYLNRNKYLYLFELSPRTFEENWGQRHLNEIVPELLHPSKQYDPNYSGEYDFWYDGIRIEVKASRAARRKSGDNLLVKALSRESVYGFDMNFQQIKPSCCDVFVWIGVWRDAIRYWVLSSEEVLNNPYYSKGQHRGNEGEGQLWIKESNIQDFEIYEVTVREILNKILEKGKK